MTAARIRFTNLLEEIRYAYLAQDFRKAELLIAEAQVMAIHERRLAEVEVAS